MEQNPCEQCFGGPDPGNRDEEQVEFCKSCDFRRRMLFRLAEANQMTREDVESLRGSHPELYEELQYWRSFDERARSHGVDPEKERC